jgi:hypothetical protein
MVSVGFSFGFNPLIQESTVNHIFAFKILSPNRPNFDRPLGYVWSRRVFVNQQKRLV